MLENVYLGIVVDPIYLHKGIEYETALSFDTGSEMLFKLQPYYIQVPKR